MGAPIKELKLPEKLPEWFALMPEDAMLNSTDIGHLLGVDRKTVHNRLSTGKLPPRDKASGVFRAPKMPISLWKKSTIINFFESKQNGR